ncbi:hypothetical protein [Pseudoclavibacter sp. RFBA6]|uniref:hypothetical protein n=1 Tax=Pseudoclavibacter sp. RFBA6 TaxID=2080573 RepID=UPI000D49E8B5|nr:hypothetical protein [Pseudoclavibacter sp. RFBA6]PPG39477.1 hypothetical protein C5C17_11850 [Pseudoclavibacter sp. RFBA6]
MASFAKAMVFPFTCTATDLPTDLMLPAPIEGAVLDFSAEAMTLGSAGGTLPNLIEGGTGLVLTSTVVAMSEANRQFLRFPGSPAAANVSSRVNTQVQTRFMRFRMRETLTAEKVLLGNSVEGGQRIVADGDRVSMLASQRLAGPSIAPGTGWHTVIAVFNGATSVLDVDGSTTSGAVGVATQNGFRIAANAASPIVYAQMDVSRVGLLPYAATTAQRNALRAALNA